jgi:hypothetical protein
MDTQVKVQPTEENACVVTVHNKRVTEFLFATWLVIYYRAFALFERRNTDAQLVFNECCTFRDKLFIDTELHIPDTKLSPDNAWCVASAVQEAHDQYQWLIMETARRRKQQPTKQ